MKSNNKLRYSKLYESFKEDLQAICNMPEEADAAAAEKLKKEIQAQLDNQQASFENLIKLLPGWVERAKQDWTFSKTEFCKALINLQNNPKYKDNSRINAKRYEESQELEELRQLKEQQEKEIQRLADIEKKYKEEQEKQQSQPESSEELERLKQENLEQKKRLEELEETKKKRESEFTQTTNQFQLLLDKLNQQNAKLDEQNTRLDKTLQDTTLRLNETTKLNETLRDELNQSRLLNETLRDELNQSRLNSSTLDTAFSFEQPNSGTGYPRLLDDESFDTEVPTKQQTGKPPVKTGSPHRRSQSLSQVPTRPITSANAKALFKLESREGNRDIAKQWIKPSEWFTVIDNLCDFNKQNASDINACANATELLVALCKDNNAHTLREILDQKLPPTEDHPLRIALNKVVSTLNLDVKQEPITNFRKAHTYRQLFELGIYFPKNAEAVEFFKQLRDQLKQSNANPVSSSNNQLVTKGNVM